MMPGIHSLSRVRASPVLEPTASLRLGFPSSVELRRQQQALQQGQAQQQLSSQNATHQRNERSSLHSALGQKEKPQAQPMPSQAPASIPESRCSGSSSGSEHEPSSEYLADLVSNFMEVEEQEVARARGSGGPGSLGDDEEDTSASGLLDLASSIEALSTTTSPIEAKVYADVQYAVKLACSTSTLLGQDAQSSDEQAAAGTMRRAVMSKLRAAGYNAAVCKSRWDHSRGFPGGDHEYLDILLSSSDSEGRGSLLTRDRLIVDLDFRAQFQIARPTPHFEAALLATPAVFVGRVERLQQLVDLLSDACRRSLRTQGMHLPPWRKVEYLRAKWLAPYKRTTNTVALTASSTIPPSAPVPAVQPLPLGQVSLAVPPAQNSFALWPESPQAASVKRMCTPAQRHRPPQRGVLGMLLQEQLKASPVS